MKNYFLLIIALFLITIDVSKSAIFSDHELDDYWYSFDGQNLVVTPKDIKEGFVPNEVIDFVNRNLETTKLCKTSLGYETWTYYKNPPTGEWIVVSIFATVGFPDIRNSTICGSSFLIGTDIDVVDSVLWNTTLGIKPVRITNSTILGKADIDYSGTNYLIISNLQGGENSDIKFTVGPIDQFHNWSDIEAKDKLTITSTIPKTVANVYFEEEATIDSGELELKNSDFYGTTTISSQNLWVELSNFHGSTNISAPTSTRIVSSNITSANGSCTGTINWNDVTTNTLNFNTCQNLKLTNFTAGAAFLSVGSNEIEGDFNEGGELKTSLSNGTPFKVNVDGVTTVNASKGIRVYNSVSVQLVHIQGDLTLTSPCVSEVVFGGLSIYPGDFSHEFTIGGLWRYRCIQEEGQPIQCEETGRASCTL